MIEINKKSNCCGCEACVNICPQKCITMVEDEEGFRYPVIDKEKCINCGLCEKNCQYIEKINKHNNAKVYACTIKDTINLKHSTTVALFFELSKVVILDGGIVYGAVYDGNMEVKHSVATNINDLEKMRSSKYVQSKIGNIYSDVKKYLNNNKTVLFSGTPCQIAGLYKFLKKDYENLITIDVICHSVPSPKVYKDYIQNIEKKYNSKVTNINFRKKEKGWLNPYTEINFEDNNINYLKPSIQDEWYRIFISHLTTRPSCNNCLYTSIDRVSDITIGDFWGIDKIKPEIKFDNGVGKVFLNTLKGESLFNKVKNIYDIYEMNMKDAIRPNLIHPPEKHPLKDKYFKYYKKYGYTRSYKKFVKENYYKKLLRKIKRKIIR